MIYPQTIEFINDTPISLATLREWTRTTEAEFSDASLLALGLGALSDIEDRSRVKLRPRICTVRMSRFDRYEIPSFPFTGITGITYFDADNIEQPLAPTDYTVESYSANDNTLVYTATTLPTLYNRWDAVKITLTEGYTEETMPENIKLAVKHLVRHSYDNPDNPKHSFPSLVDMMLKGFSRDVFA